MPAELSGFNDGGVYVSTDGGANYAYLDCGWVNGRDDQILYQLWWQEDGEYSLTIINTNEGITSQFTGTLPTSAVNTLGVAVMGNSSSETIQFDQLAFQSAPFLAMQRSGDSLLLSWSTGFAGYSLQSSSDLGQSDSWLPVAETILSEDGMNSVSLPMTSTQQFFRLAK